uniref:RING-type E3 ubiquitin transferase n=1 Tax=Vitis vinifera TaxID=29760 RepID=A5BDC3_VITVI|nr:hypothetical protein VITISV_029417 [Vitis vinifera]
MAIQTLLEALRQSLSSVKPGSQANLLYIPLSPSFMPIKLTTRNLSRRRGIFIYSTIVVVEEPINPSVNGKYTRHLINGQFVDVASRNTFKTLDPRIGKVVANVAEGDVEYINRAFLAARKTFDEGPCPRMTPYVLVEYGNQLRRSIFEAYFGILQGFKNSRPELMLPHAEKLLQFIESVSGDNKSEVIDPPQSEDMMEVSEHVNDPVHTTLKPNVTISSSVQELLEYPVCLNAMYYPIHQCSNDHTWCSRCKSRVHNRCLTCMHELGNIRCLVLERIVMSLELPCKYQSFGCLGTYPNYNKLKHESQCVYRPYYCPYAGPECTVISNIPYLVTHLKDDRKIDTHNGSTFIHCYVKSNPHEVFSFLGQYFCLHFEAFQL